MVRICGSSIHSPPPVLNLQAISSVDAQRDQRRGAEVVQDSDGVISHVLKNFILGS